jgi:ATP-dependent DNA ligase
MGIAYNSYRYLYPPRPETQIPSNSIQTYEGKYFAQPKLNGSSLIVFTNGVQVIIKNRHNEDITNVKMDRKEFLSLHRGKGWMIISGEYMNKSQKNAKGNFFNHKFVIWDIIAINNQQIIGQTFEERIKLLDNLYGTEDCEDPFLYKINEYTYRVKTFTSDFQKLFQELIVIGMYEGLVFKKKDARLKNGTRSNNNSSSQLKCRKPTKNYKY